ANLLAGQGPERRPVDLQVRREAARDQVQEPLAGVRVQGVAPGVLPRAELQTALRVDRPLAERAGAGADARLVPAEHPAVACGGRLPLKARSAVAAARGGSGGPVPGRRRPGTAGAAPACAGRPRGHSRTATARGACPRAGPPARPARGRLPGPPTRPRAARPP